LIPPAITDNECIRRWDMLQFFPQCAFCRSSTMMPEKCVSYHYHFTIFPPCAFYDSPFPVCLFAMKNPRVTHRGLVSRIREHSFSSSNFLSSDFWLEMKKDATTNVFLINDETFYDTMKLDIPRRSFLLTKTA